MIIKYLISLRTEKLGVGLILKFYNQWYNECMCTIQLLIVIVIFPFKLHKPLNLSNYIGSAIIGCFTFL